jgi:hypothetical protein
LGSIRRIIAVGTVHTGEILRLLIKELHEFGEDIVAFILVTLKKSRKNC